MTLRDLVPYEEVPELLCALDAVVMLPEREPFSNSVIEAMAMAKPVILSRTLGNIEAVEDGRSGVLVDRGDRKALAAALRRLLENPKEAEEMGRAACGRVRSRFTETVMMDGMEALWRKLRSNESRYPAEQHRGVARKAGVSKADGAPEGTRM